MSTKKLIPVLGLLVFILLICSTELAAQCPMCKMSAESNMKGGGTFGNGLNAGIIYMLATPYLLVGTIGFIWWRNRKKANETESAELI
jgi:hypothetical protein